MSDAVSLAAEFPAATEEQWRRLVDGVLKGAPFEKRLISRTYDGLLIDPLYPRDAGAKPVPGRAAATPWQVLQRIDHPDPAAANAQALHDLNNGATGLALVLAGSPAAHGFGLEPSPAAIARALDGVLFEAGVAVELDLGGNRDAALAVADLVASRSVAPQETDIRFGLDPFGAIARGRSAREPWPVLAEAFAATAGELAARGFRSPIAAADGRTVHAAGGSEAQELAYVLAALAAWLRALAAHGMSLDVARAAIFARLAADADEFLGIAKFRALRKLVARIDEACGLPALPLFVSAETAWRMMTRYDPWVNVLRTTVAAFSAGLGGANAVTVMPFTAALGLPDAFARRLARNTQLILLEESNLAKVSDPAAGSGALEDLTDELCGAAWTLFQEIEAAGGLAAALTSGAFTARVAKVRAEREAAVARGRDPLTGTSEFPDIAERAVAVLTPAPETDAAPAAGALAPFRLAEPFEALRAASDRALATTGRRPSVFLANLGTPSDFTARATFAKNFFEAGGIAAVTNDGFASQAALVDAFRASGAPLVCLCSSNDLYARDAVAVAGALKAAGAALIYLAGRPGDLEAALKAVGVTTFIYAGGDMLATLRAAHDSLGIER